jgi:histidinol-phosphate phosphatase family protein
LPERIARAVFLDRDGVLNRDSDDFIRTPGDIQILPGVPGALKRLNDAGFLTLVITNQSGIGRGYFTEKTLGEIHARLIQEVESGGGRIAGVYHCPHLPDSGCDCRKPLPGMLRRAAGDHGIEFSESYFIGDRREDIACGLTVGARTILVLSGKSSAGDVTSFDCKPDYVAKDLVEAAEWIVSRDNRI